jgi:hypothetical protein
MWWDYQPTTFPAVPDYYAHFNQYIHSAFTSGGGANVGGGIIGNGGQVQQATGATGQTPAQAGAQTGAQAAAGAAPDYGMIVLAVVAFALLLRRK